MEEKRIARPAVCPACGAPGTYEFYVAGPVEEGGQKFVIIRHHFKCDICGHAEDGAVHVPLEALYRVRYLLVPEALAVVEKAKLVSDLEGLKGAAVTG